MNRGEAIRIQQQYTTSSFFPFCNGKYR
ncbi:hypothetical protein [Escherichia coli]